MLRAHGTGHAFALSLLLVSLPQGHSTGLCPTSGCSRTAPDGSCFLADHKRFECKADRWKQHITSYPNKWFSLAAANSWGVSIPDDLPALEYITDYAPCCRHCVWSLGFPLAVPMVMAISPKQDTCDAAGSGFSLCYLDCTKFVSDFALLDKDASQKLNYSEFQPYFADYFVAPANNYKLYSGGALDVNPKLSRIDPAFVFSNLDINQDFAVSLEEWKVFRHFWSPTYVSKTGPSKMPEDGRPIAEGPLGGLFIDQAFLAIWQTNMINMMLEYYLDKRSKVLNGGFMSYDVREPVAPEKKEIMRIMDLDGSERVSLEEHYFRVFADTNGDGYLDANEYYSSLYRTDCIPLCPTDGCKCGSACNEAGVVLADCPAANPDMLGRDEPKTVDGLDLQRNFKMHDLDGDGKISFLERKFVAADKNRNRAIDESEWKRLDFPTQYGPFRGHCNKEEDDCELDVPRYLRYLAFHYCAHRGSLAYLKETSSHPWSNRCTLKVQVYAQEPFVMARGFDTPNQRTALEDQGWLCWSGDPIQPQNYCFDGYTVQTFNKIAQRLKWDYRLVYMGDQSAAGNNSWGTLKALSSKNGAERSEVVIGLFSQYQTPPQLPEYNPSHFSCSDSIMENDGLVTVKPSEDRTLSLELAILALILSPSFVNFLAFTYFCALVVGHFFWYVEKDANPDQFSPGYLQGTFEGLWFSIVTVTSVGYGDQAPISSLGKAGTFLWMFFGMLCYGVFAGGVSGEISTSAAEASINSVYDLNGFKIGVLETMAEPVVRGFKFDEDFAWRQVLCKDLDDCQKKLLDTREIVAFIAPRSDVYVHFQRLGLNDFECGNPMKIVGNSFTTQQTARWTGFVVKTCAFSESTYATKYLMQGVSTTVETLKADGTIAALSDKYLSQEQPLANLPQCTPPTGYNVRLIIITAVVMLVYFGLIKASALWEKRRAQNAIETKLKESLLRALGVTRTPEALARKYGNRWLTKWRANREIRRREKLEQLKKRNPHDKILSAIHELEDNQHTQRAMSMKAIKHARNVNLRASRLIKFLRVIGFIIFATLTGVTVSTLSMWAQRVRVLDI